MAPKRKTGGAPADRYSWQNKIPKISDSTTDIITLKTTRGFKYKVHAHLLAQYSYYFRNALNEGSKRLSVIEVEILFREQAVMDLFVDWLYSKSYKASSAVLKDIGTVSSPYTKNSVPTAYLVWMFGDCYEIPQLQNDIMRRLYSAKEDYISWDDFSPDYTGDLPVTSAVFKFHSMILASRMIEKSLGHDRRGGGGEGGELNDEDDEDDIEDEEDEEDGDGEEDMKDEEYYGGDENNKDDGDSSYSFLSNLPLDLVVAIATHLAPRHGAIFDRHSLEYFLVSED